MKKSGFFLAILATSWLLARPALAIPQESAVLETKLQDSKSVVTLINGDSTEATADVIGNLLGKANELIGTPYRSGGSSPLSGFDCSGFVGYLFKTNLAMSLPRSSKDMSRVGEKVEKSELKPGDLLFFKTVKRSISHVGIYVGDGKFIHSPWHGRSVEVAHLSMKYWTSRFAIAKRLDLPETLSNPLSATPPAAATPQP
jgi:cell wall-associated NlpC family hydrolase